MEKDAVAVTAEPPPGKERERSGARPPRHAARSREAGTERHPRDQQPPVRDPRPARVPARRGRAGHEDASTARPHAAERPRDQGDRPHGHRLLPRAHDERIECDLDELAGEAVELFRRTSVARDIESSVEASAGPLTVVASRRRSKVALLDAAPNAEQAMPPAARRGRRCRATTIGRRPGRRLGDGVAPSTPAGVPLRPVLHHAHRAGRRGPRTDDRPRHCSGTTGAI